MSFEYNPFTRIEIAKDANGLLVFCKGCELGVPLTNTEVTIAGAFKAMATHVVNVHGRTRRDFDMFR